MPRWWESGGWCNSLLEPGPMQKIEAVPTREQTLIIVAPPTANIRVVRARANEIVAFTSTEEFDRWLVHATKPQETIACDVGAALTQVGCAMSSLPGRLRAAIETLAKANTVPRLNHLERSWTSRRSFYRTWCARIRETPSAFLRRVRAIHARRLLARGLSRKEVAFIAGFSSVDQMRRSVGRKNTE